MTGWAGRSWRDPRLGAAKQVELPSGPLRYHETGTGPTLVFVHGYLVNANLWRALVPLLSPAFRCITPDWPLGAHLVPMRPDADLTPPGMAAVIGQFLDALDLVDVTLVGNDSGGAYSQIAATTFPDRIARLVLNSCETPECSWPPTPGGFRILKATAAHPATYRALYQALRLHRTWRWRNTYGWMAKYPIDTRAMESFIGPVLDDPAIRHDGRKAIGSVSAHYSRDAAARLTIQFAKPVLLAWAEEDRVFPLAHARRFAERLDTPLETVSDSYVYTAEDQPDKMAALITAWSPSRDDAGNG
ncbi:alpha/beta fold hydrolase [Amycolatopsis pittospori]|uniref:alpha/beta fold hydrolase n=1 Tax=Amycolatopsis pittospori TaxID=2749434 RepID=UPI0015F0791E|nr:alpha/beta hydrolase [Amycolatopsis pittospori]